MSMTNQEQFAARLVRIQSAAAHTKGTIFVGTDEQHVIPRAAPQAHSRTRETASNALYPISLLGAFVLGLMSVALGYYARFQLVAMPQALEENADLDMGVSAIIGMMISFVVAQMFRLTAKEYKAMQGAGVFVMICAFHNLAHWAPGPMEVLFSPDWVQKIQLEAPPNSAKFRGVYFPLFEAHSPAGDIAGGAADCGAGVAPAVTVFSTDNAKKPTGSGQKTVEVTKADTCAEP